MLLLSVQASAQNGYILLHGTVRDAATGERLPGALVSTSSRAAYTDAEGRYELSVPAGRREVTCYLLGYGEEKKTVECSEDTLLDLSLQEYYAAIEGVIVLGDRSSKPLGSSFGKIEVDMKNLQMQPLFLGEQDIFKYLQLLPGVSGGKDGSSNLNIRGGSADQTQILLDGIPVYNQNHALGFVSVFNGEALRGAELYKGGIPALYGGRLSGVAAITTRNGDTERHRQTLGIGTLTASFTAEGPVKDKGSYIFSGRYFTPNALLGAYYTIARPDTRGNYLFFDFTGRMHFRLDDRNDLTWALYCGYDAMTYRADQKSGEGDDLYEYRLRDGISWGSLTGTVKLLTRLKGDWRMENSAYYSGMMNRYKTDSRDNASGSLHAFTRSAVGDVGARSVFTFTTPVTEIKTGLQLTLQRYIPKDIYSKSVSGDGRTIENSANNGTRLLYNAALFADGNSRTGRWSFHYGLRIPLYYNKKDLLLSIEPRAGVSFEINGRNDLFLSYDRTTQPLFSLTKQFMGVPMDLWMPYQSRELQSADQVSAGWKYRPTEFIFVSVEAYWKKMNNLYFVSDEDAMLVGKGGYDIGTGRAIGAELVFQYTGRTNMVLLSYTHSSSKRYVAGRRFDFEYDIPYNLNIYFRQRTLKRGDREHYFSVNLNYHAGLPYIASKEIYPDAIVGSDWPEYIPNNPLYPNVRLPDYFRLDLNYSMERKLRNGKRVWQFSILNATNHFNPQMVYIDKGRYVGLSLIPILPSFSYKRYW